MVNILYLSIPGIGVSDIRGEFDCHCEFSFSVCLEIRVLEIEPRLGWGGENLQAETFCDV